MLGTYCYKEKIYTFNLHVQTQDATMQVYKKQTFMINYYTLCVLIQKSYTLIYITVVLLKALRRL